MALLTFILITFLVLTPLSQTTTIITLLFHLTATLFPLSEVTQALLSRVSSLRSSRGDKGGAHRAKFLADQLNHLTSRRFWKTFLTVAWTGLRFGTTDGIPFSYRNLVNFYESTKRWLVKVGKFKDGIEMEVYAEKNYQDINQFFKTLYTTLFSAAITSEPLKQVLEEEIEKGDLLRDCLAVGGKELKSLFQVLKDLASQFNTTDEL